MNLKECYAAAGGDYNEVAARFMKEERIAKFALKFLDDKSYESLVMSLAAQDYKEAFRAAHTLKGVSQNLGFTALYEPSSTLSDLLRNEEPVDTSSVMLEVTAAYQKTIDAIKAYKESV